MRSPTSPAQGDGEIWNIQISDQIIAAGDAPERLQALTRPHVPWSPPVPQRPTPIGRRRLPGSSRRRRSPRAATGGSDRRRTDHGRSRIVFLSTNRFARRDGAPRAAAHRVDERLMQRAAVDIRIRRPSLPHCGSVRSPRPVCWTDRWMVKSFRAYVERSFPTLASAVAFLAWVCSLRLARLRRLASRAGALGVVGCAPPMPACCAACATARCRRRCRAPRR